MRYVFAYSQVIVEELAASPHFAFFLSQSIPAFGGDDDGEQRAARRRRRRSHGDSPLFIWARVPIANN